jgi:predicted MFS family arabinose efflux permease
MSCRNADTHAVHMHPVELTIMFTAFIAATYGFGVYLFATILPDMRSTLSFTYSNAGLMIGLAQLGFLLAALFSGFLSEKVGAGRLIVGSVAICCAGLFAIGLAANTMIVGILLFILGIVAATVWVPMVEVVQSAVPKRHEAKALGLISSGTAYGIFFNSLTIPSILPAHGWRAIWFLTASATLILLLWALLRFRNSGTSNHKREAYDLDGTSPLKILSGLMFQPITITILAMMFLAGIACMPTQNYLISFIRDDLGYSLAEASRAWSAIGLIGMIGGFVMGSVADRLSIHKSLFITFLLLAVSIATFIAKLAWPSTPFLGSCQHS